MWEYMAVNVNGGNLTQELNIHGLSAWELVQMIPTTQTNFYCVFKRKTARMLSE